jgi:hypothetical protein
MVRKWQARPTIPCTALPPWPGDDVAVIVDGPWVPRVDSEPAQPPPD